MDAIAYLRSPSSTPTLDASGVYDAIRPIQGAGDTESTRQRREDPHQVLRIYRLVPGGRGMIRFDRRPRAHPSSAVAAPMASGISVMRPEPLRVARTTPSHRVGVASIP
jgi:ribosomal protein L34E